MNLSTSHQNRSIWHTQVAALGGITLMQHLFAKFDAAYPHWWRQAFPTQEAINNWEIEWAEAFELEKINPKDIKGGLAAIRTKYEKPPSLAQFLKACKPEVDPFVLYCEAVAGVSERKQGKPGKWSHPAVYWAAMPLSFDLATQTYAQVSGRFYQALNEEMSKMEWPPIPEPVLALPEPGKSPTSKEHAAKMIEELGAAGIGKPTEDTVWYHKILKREKAGDKSVSLIQLRFAQEAAGNHGVTI